MQRFSLKTETTMISKGKKISKMSKHFPVSVEIDKDQKESLELWRGKGSRIPGKGRSWNKQGKRRRKRTTQKSKRRWRRYGSRPTRGLQWWSRPSARGLYTRLVRNLYKCGKFYACVGRMSPQTLSKYKWLCFLLSLDRDSNYEDWAEKKMKKFWRKILRNR